MNALPVPQAMAECLRLARQFGAELLASGSHGMLLKLRGQANRPALVMVRMDGQGCVLSRLAWHRTGVTARCDFNATRPCGARDSAARWLADLAVAANLGPLPSNWPRELEALRLTIDRRLNAGVPESGR